MYKPLLRRNLMIHTGWRLESRKWPIEPVMDLSVDIIFWLTSEWKFERFCLLTIGMSHWILTQQTQLNFDPLRWPGLTGKMQPYPILAIYTVILWENFDWIWQVQSNYLSHRYLGGKFITCGLLTSANKRVGRKTEKESRPTSAVQS